MDTIYSRLNHERILILCANVVLITAFMLSQKSFVLADNIRIVNGIVSPPIINSLQLENRLDRLITERDTAAEFDSYITRKYANCKIYDVGKGIKHIKLIRYYQGKPVRLNVIETDLNVNPNIKIEPVLASKTLSHKASITTMAKNNNSPVAVNGAFFLPQTGCPLGTMMINKKLYTGPVFNRVAMGFFDNGFAMDRIKLDASLKFGWNSSLKIDNINQPRMSVAYVLAYTSDWGEISPYTPKNGVQIVVSDGKIISISKSREKIPQNGFVIVGPQSALSGLKVNEKVSLDIKTSPEWENVNHIISGGPYLVKDGEIYIDIKDEKLLAIGGRNPRTAIGYTKDNRFIIVTADGREGSSIGLTLKELACYMQKLGCVNAMNLDGGGSTVMYVNGCITNKPPVKGGIALSNALTISLRE
ncbi:MAG: phosphodiester glycosidase family protein [Candidatus Gastranaerophilales bacterium]|nr:phosphodiester glycosidase family protein [Candidatus Gastranaerophilales bacterium]